MEREQSQKNVFKLHRKAGVMMVAVVGEFTTTNNVNPNLQLSNHENSNNLF